MDDEQLEPSQHTGASAEQDVTLLPADRAFVVQFRRSSAMPLAEPAGRVEHLVSGVATQFRTWPELHHFVARVLGGESGGVPSGGRPETISRRQ